MKSGPERELLERYLVRSEKAGRQIGIEGVTAQDWPESREARAGERMASEAGQLIAALRPGGYAITLDETGRDMTSRDFAELLKAALEAGRPEVSLMIGGPDGHGEAVRQRADAMIRFGRLTWPHQLVRMLAAEQLYRAITILTGHPYHRD